MMYTCAPRDAAASRGRGRKMVKRSNKTFAVDRMGMDVQAISTSPYDMGYYKPVSS